MQNANNEQSKSRSEQCDIEIRELQRRLIGKRYEGANLSECSFEDPLPQRIVNWLVNKKGFLVYLGSPGCGKTYFCSAMMSWVHKKVRSYRYWHEREFFSRVQSHIAASQKGSYIDQVSYLMDDEFVMLDDIGSMQITEWKKDVLLQVIDERYELTKPTIFTSNLTRGDLTELLGKRSAGRLFAKENLIIETHDAEDYRQR